jgi:hypothetical protein
MGKSLTQKLLQMEVELHLYRKKASTFSEEAVINSVIYSIGNAMDILNGKKTLLQGLKSGEDNDQR